MVARAFLSGCYVFAYWPKKSKDPMPQVSMIFSHFNMTQLSPTVIIFYDVRHVKLYVRPMRKERGF